MIFEYQKDYADHSLSQKFNEGPSLSLYIEGTQISELKIICPESHRCPVEGPKF